MSGNDKGRGKGIAFLRALVGHQGDECVIWPLCRLAHTGYGIVSIDGETYYASRIMCELAKGPPPSPDHESAHSCNKGHDGCVNPRHLSWKTHSGNQLDRRANGTSGKRSPLRHKLTPEQVAEIRSLKGIETQAVIAARFGVSRENICIIQGGKSWKTGKRETGASARARSL